MTITRNSRPTSVRSTWSAFSLAALAAGAFSIAAADTLTGPFVPGTGHWDTITAGDFELLTTPDGVNFSLAYWQEQQSTFPPLGHGDVTGANPIAGNWSAELVADRTFGSNGFARMHQFQSLASGEYVLSGFIRREAAGADLFLDLFGYADLRLSSLPGTSETQFVWGVFDAPNFPIAARFAMDGPALAGDAGIFDEIAITPLSEFVAPTPVPEPANATVACGAILAAAALWRRAASRATAGRTGAERAG